MRRLQPRVHMEVAGMAKWHPRRWACLLRAPTEPWNPNPSPLPLARFPARRDLSHLFLQPPGSTADSTPPKSHTDTLPLFLDQEMHLNNQKRQLTVTCRALILIGTLCTLVLIGTAALFIAASTPYFSALGLRQRMGDHATVQDHAAFGSLAYLPWWMTVLLAALTLTLT